MLEARRAGRYPPKYATVLTKRITVAKATLSVGAVPKKMKIPPVLWQYHGRSIGSLGAFPLCADGIALPGNP